MENENEKFRSKLKVELLKAFGIENTESIMKIIDKATYPYDLIRKETAIVPYDYGLKETIERYASELMLNGVKKNSVKNYCYIIRDFFVCVRKPIDKVNTKDVRNWIAYQQSRFKDATIACKESAINNFFTWCVEDELIVKSPMIGIKFIKPKCKEKKPLTEEERVLMYNACKNEREKAIYKVMENTGCRIGELVKIRLEDINMEAKEIEIIHGKGDKQRTVYFDARTKIDIENYLRTRNDDSEMLFVTSEGVPFNSTHSVRSDFNAIVKRAGIKRKITPHLMRHTFVSRMLESGTDINIVAKIVGHSSIETTNKVYAHVQQSTVKNEYVRFAS